ncbi:hypothetical protein AVEN_25267-1 [Araneus ventricosus]|uniref:Uncharacterized protein n=1 Tax=Araneus ventricosus TaxID=182803 RepID=A0A4Y2VG30_ARAVE|nr:hypothetical protein AVEN_25267-1 [Araneus ventricosus]
MISPEKKFTSIEVVMLYRFHDGWYLTRDTIFFWLTQALAEGISARFQSSSERASNPIPSITSIRIQDKFLSSGDRSRHRDVIVKPVLDYLKILYLQSNLKFGSASLSGYHVGSSMT